MTTVKANRPLFYNGEKHQKGDTFELVENDGVLWGKGVIDIVKIEEDEDPPEVVRPVRKKKKSSPRTLSELNKKVEAERETLAKRKGLKPGDLK